MIFTLLILATTITSVTSQCETCKDGGQCCGSTSCCIGGNFTTSVCCDNPTESCCQGVCCIKETTFCCLAVADHPDRCCPRWTVCCAGGQDGCCTPEEADRLDTPPPSTNNQTLYALFLEVSTLQAVAIDANTGKITANQKVTGYNAWGEMTRVFAYDHKRNLFYLVEANYTGPDPPPGQDPHRPVTLYTVNPVTAVATATLLRNVYNFPTGFIYSCKLDALIFAVEKFAVNGTQNGYYFYKIDPTTFMVTLLTTSDLNGDNSYAGWIHELAWNGTASYRLGYRNVVDETEPGLGITSIASPTAITTWVDVAAPPTHKFYETLVVASDNTFYSLATETNAKQGYDLFHWSLSTPAKMIAQYGNAHPVPFFGWITSTMTCDGKLLVSATVEDHFPGITGDRWTFHLTNLVTGNDTVLEITPHLPANEVALSGLGVPVGA